MKKLFEAEINLMISIGFDFLLTVGFDYLQEWEKAIRDRNFLKQVCGILNKLYHTSVVLYFQPKTLALTALAMAAKNEGITPEISGWDNDLLLNLKSHQETIQCIMEIYYKKMN